MKGFTVSYVTLWSTALSLLSTHGPKRAKEPNSLEGPSLEGLANHTRTELLLPLSFSGLVKLVRTPHLGHRLNKGSVPAYCKYEFIS